MRDRIGRAFPGIRHHPRSATRRRRRYDRRTLTDSVLPAGERGERRPALRRLRRASGPGTLSESTDRPRSLQDAAMPPNSTAPLANEYFQVKRHGDVAVIVPSPEVEQLPDNLIQ